jgi:hypothetical protein
MLDLIHALADAHRGGEVANHVDVFRAAFS